MTEPHIQLLDDLEREVLRAAHAVSRRGRTGLPRLGRFGWRTPAVAIGLVGLLAGGAAAAGVLDGEHNEPAEPPAGVTAAPARMFVEGETENGHGWQLAASDDGARFCLMLLVESPAPDVPGAPDLRAWARSRPNCSLVPNTVGAAVGDSMSDGMTWLYGTAPMAAATVSIRAGGGGEYRANTVDAEQQRGRGRFFVLEIPAEALRDSTIVFSDQTGASLEDPAPTTGLLERSSPRS